MPPVVNAPIIIDVGKTRKRRIRELAQGCGKHAADVQDALADVTTSLGDQADGKQLVPVVLVYRKKSRRRKKKNNPASFFPFF